MTQNDWQGSLSGTVQSVRLERGWPVALIGAFQMTGLTPPGSNLPVGDYALEFDGKADTPTQLVGRVRDLAAASYAKRRSARLASDKAKRAEIGAPIGRPQGTGELEYETRDEIDAAYARAAAEPSPYRVEQFVGGACCLGGWT